MDAAKRVCKLDHFSGQHPHLGSLDLLFQLTLHFLESNETHATPRDIVGAHQVKTWNLCMVSCEYLRIRAVRQCVYVTPHVDNIANQSVNAYCSLAGDKLKTQMSGEHPESSRLANCLYTS